MGSRTHDRPFHAALIVFELVNFKKKHLLMRYYRLLRERVYICVAISQYILGVRPDFDGLRVNPPAGGERDVEVVLG